MYYTAFATSHSNVFTTCDKELHLQDKRLMSAAFSKSNILGQEAMIRSKIDRLMDLIAERVSHNKSVPLYPAFRSLALDAITAFCYGDGPGVLDDGEFRSDMFEALEGTLKPIITGSTCDCNSCGHI